MLIFLVVLAVLAIMADAITTRRGIMLGKSEFNEIRKFLIDLLGVNAGTLGVGAALSGTFAVVCLLAGSTQSTIVSCIMVISLFGFIAHSNYKRY